MGGFDYSPREGEPARSASFSLRGDSKRKTLFTLSTHEPREIYWSAIRTRSRKVLVEPGEQAAHLLLVFGIVRVALAQPRFLPASFSV